VSGALLTKELFRSELLGHERGAFTGEARRMAGLAPRRSSGRLFIDKVGEFPPDAQRASRKRLALSARNAVNRDQLAALIVVKRV
jgi:DNA-binding NtrC family response regulator